MYMCIATSNKEKWDAFSRQLSCFHMDRANTCAVLRGHATQSIEMLQAKIGEPYNSTTLRLKSYEGEGVGVLVRITGRNELCPWMNLVGLANRERCSWMNIASL